MVLFLNIRRINIHSGDNLKFKGADGVVVEQRACARMFCVQVSPQDEILKIISSKMTSV